MIIPLVEQPDKTFKALFAGEQKIAKTSAEIAALEKKIRFSGYYPYRTNIQDMKELNVKKNKVDEIFLDLVIETLKNWIQLADERLKGTGIQCYITGGNDDRLEIEPILNSSNVIVNPEGKLVDIDEHHEMISSGYSNMTPWHCPRDISEIELAKKIESMAIQVKNMKNCIFNLHAPPYNTIIDTALELDKDFKPVTRQGRPSEIPVGSTAVRESIEKYQPLLGLHGHIHESRGSYKLGRTLCLNPGSEYGEGILRGVIISLDKKGIKGYFPTSG
jgi:Icc-related predicted phosphoesterase